MASATVTGKISGMKEFADAINSLGQEMGEKVLQSAVRKAAVGWRDRAKQRAPTSDHVHVISRKGKLEIVSPGNLRRHIKVKKLKAFKGNLSKEGRYGIIVTKEAWYWIFLEFGVAAYNISAQPMFRNTFNEMKDAAFNDIAAAARNHVARLQKKGRINSAFVF